MNLITDENNQKYDLRKTCRTCLKSDDSQIFWSFLEFDNHQNIGIPIRIIDELAIMKLKISPNDGLPQKICMDCTDRLKEFHTFRTESERSQEILQQYYNKLISTAKVTQLQKECVQMTKKVHADFEFIDTDIKDDINIDTGNYYDNANCYNSNCNINNAKNIVTTDLFNQKNHIDDIDENCSILLSNIEVKKLQEETISHKSSDQINYQIYNDLQLNLNKIDNNYVSLMKPNIIDDEDDVFIEKFHEETIAQQHGNDNDSQKKDTTLKTNQNCKSKTTKELKTTNAIPHTTKYKNRIPRCKYCKEIFNTMESMEEHLKTEHPIDRPHLCPICKKGFKKASNRTDHLDTHVKEHNFNCDECVRRFKSERALKVHKQQNHRTGQYLCPYCPSDFIVKGLYKLHLRRKHSLSGSSPSTLRLLPQTISHKTRKLMKKFKCNLCEKAFVARVQLRDHERTHTGERPYLCNVCGKDFINNSSLAVHYQIHENERKYKCPICDKRFNLRSTLKTHKITHSGLQPFQCEICEIKFTRKSSVNQHMKYKHKLKLHSSTSTTTSENT